MRGLTEEEYLELSEIEEFTGRHCTLCGRVPSDDEIEAMAAEDDPHPMYEDFLLRGLILPVDCEVYTDVLHADITELGKLALRIHVASMNPDLANPS